MILYDTYVVKLWAPDRDLDPDQEDAFNMAVERFDQTVRKAADEAGQTSALVIAIGGEWPGPEPQRREVDEDDAVGGGNGGC